jgi:hypothetical protein
MSTPDATPGGEVLVYEAADGSARVDVRLERETVWLTQDQMARLFGRERSVVTKHIRNAFREGELEAQATRAKFSQVQSEGARTVTREVEHYNLDVIISVGYRVKSVEGTRFRQWAAGAAAAPTSSPSTCRSGREVYSMDRSGSGHSFRSTVCESMGYLFKAFPIRGGR